MIDEHGVEMIATTPTGNNAYVNWTVYVILVLKL